MVRTLAAALATSTCIVALATPAAAQTREYNIPAGSLKDALDAYVKQSGRQLIYRADEVRSARSPGANGQLSSNAALDILLTGSGFTTKVDGDLIAITRVKKNGTTGAASIDRVSSDAVTHADDNSEILVTGTRVRGGRTASPVLTINAENIRRQGFENLGEVIRSVPQNFGGGQNPGIVGGAEGGGIANQNISGGSSLNLRGLGPDATLTLLNGRRLAYSGFVQAVDISTIPIEAVDRIEIVPDGASAIYGSDAVGGVGNVILKRDFEGVTVGARFGGATDGGLATREFTLTTGTRWSTGGFIFAAQKTSSDPVYARQRAYTDYLPDPITLYPDSDLYAGLLSVHQSLGSAVELRLDAIHSKRDQLTISGATTAYYPSTPSAKSTFVSPSIEISLPHDWEITLGGAWGRDETIAELAIVTRATGVVTPFARSLYKNETLSYELDAEGPIFRLPGGDAKLAIGAGYKRNTFLQRSLVSGSTAADGSDASRFAYAEFNLPVIGADQAMPAIRRLEFTAAIRGEDYDSSGSVVTPKLGIIYDPNADFTVKASWGKSFKAPTLLQLYQTQYASLYPAASVGGVGYDNEATALVPIGGNPDLKPERARTWSASLQFHPAAISGLEAEFNWFDIEFTGRIAQPLVSLAQALSNPAYSQFIEYSPNPDELNDVISDSDFRNYTGATYDPANVVAIAFDRYINTTAQHVKGLDFSASYRFTVGLGELTTQASVSWLDSSQQATSTDAIRKLSGTLFYPAKVSARAGIIWAQGGFSAAAFGNYRSSVTNLADETHTGSFTTVDATLRYAVGPDRGWLSGVNVALSGTNIFDRAPPLYTPTSPFNPPYDSTNFSAIGRVLSVSVSKHF